MKKLAKKDEEVKIISMVVPSVNGDWSKQMIMLSDTYEKLRNAADLNKGISQRYFALFVDSNVFHDVLDSGHGCITKVQFDEIMKEEYNATLGFDKQCNRLKNIQ